MYVCVSNYSSQTTEPICIKIKPANRASYADCYRLLRFEIFTKYDEYCPRERAAVAQSYDSFALTLGFELVIFAIYICFFITKI